MTHRRGRHRLGVALVGLVFLGAATMLDGLLPGGVEDPGAQSFVRTAAVGEQVDLRTMTVEVDQVRLSRVLRQYGTELRSPGTWVLVDYTIEAAEENTAVGFAEVKAEDGRVWSLVGRNDSICPAGPPGVPVGCVAYFEVPPSAVAGLSLIHI